MATETIKYSLTFLSEWHAGSGLSSGADADAVVIKDKNNLPYLPGKTIKGLLKDVFEDFKEVQSDLLSTDFINTYFGEFDSENNKSQQGSLFFSNATVSQKEQDEISLEMSSFLYKNIASTKIDDKGVAVNASLRTIEVCIPIHLEGEIQGVEAQDKPTFEIAFKYLRHLGASRNRGLGRCKIEIKTK
jgi:CRISPR/Cas system CSM-associated protein Csm3 (group 7 of RAMP superfamily)